MFCATQVLGTGLTLRVTQELGASFMFCAIQVLGTSLASNFQQNVTRSYCVLVFCISSNHFIVTWVLILTQIVSER